MKVEGCFFVEFARIVLMMKHGVGETVVGWFVTRTKSQLRHCG